MSSQASPQVPRTLMNSSLICCWRGVSDIRCSRGSFRGLCLSKDDAYPRTVLAPSTVLSKYGGDAAGGPGQRRVLVPHAPVMAGDDLGASLRRQLVDEGQGRLHLGQRGEREERPLVLDLLVEVRRVQIGRASCRERGERP